MLAQRLKGQWNFQVVSAKLSELSNQVKKGKAKEIYFRLGKVLTARRCYAFD